MRNQPRERESKRCAGFERLLNGRKHRVFTKAPTAQVDFLRSGYFELAALLRRRDIDTGAAQLVEMLLSVLGGKDMVGTLAALDAVAYERQQGGILLLRGTEERTDVPIGT